MKELKFMVWDKERECYLDETELAGITPDGKYILYIEEEEISKLEIEGNYIVEQYTGLKDKNGKEIYEGDVANIQGIKYYVDFEHGGFWFNNDNLKWKANRPFTHFQEINDTEVIGNIHENADLMRGK